MKNLFKPLTILIVFVLIYACQNQDEIDIENNFEQDNIKYEEITFKQFSEIEAPETLIALKNHLDTSVQLKSNSNESDEKFTIRTDLIKKIVNKGYASYTFMIEDNDEKDDVFENLVVQKIDTGYIYYKIKYSKKPKDSEIPYEAKIKEVPEEKLDLEIFSAFLKSGGGANDCPRVTYLRCSVGGNPDGHDPVLQWNDKYCSGSPTIYDFYGCDWNSNDSGNDSDQRSPYTTDGGNESDVGGSSSGPSAGGTTTSPTDPGLEDTSEMDEHNMNRVLALDINFSEAQEDFLIRNPYLIGLIENFIAEDNSQEAKDFLIVATEAIRNNGIVNFDDKIIIDKDFEDNICLKSVYDEMSKGSAFKTYLENFRPEFSVANLRFAASSTLSSSVNAETSAPEHYLITMTFNTNKLDRPALVIARTFIHEMIHAEIFRKLLSVAQAPSIGLTRRQVIQLRNDYPGLYDYYMRWNWNIPAGGAPSNAQHEAMSTHYRGIIKQALKHFDHTQPDALYEALSWTGLMGDGTFNSSTGLYSNSTQAWKNLTQTERLNMISQVNAFISSNSNCQ